MLAEGTVYPLSDYQVIHSHRDGEERVMGEISVPHRESVCWTLQGNWYRRKDGVEMTGINGKVMTVKRFYQLRRTGKL